MSGQASAIQAVGPIFDGQSPDGDSSLAGWDCQSFRVLDVALSTSGPSDGVVKDLHMAAPTSASSADPNVAAVTATHTAAGDAVLGRSDTGKGVHGVSVSSFGVLGESTTGRGVVALSDTDYALRAASRTMPGIRASSQLGTAIEGWAKGSQVGVLGLSDGPGIGIAGRSNDGTGATGNSTNGTGVHGVNEAGNGDGVVGEGRRGVVGLSKGFQGVYGHSDSNAGVVGESQTMDGVWGISHNPQAAGVSGHNPNGLAGFFDGNVIVTGDLMLSGADYAENFDQSVPAGGGVATLEPVEPGSVMVLDECGGLRLSEREYDTAVAGVVSGGGHYSPGVILDAPHGVDQTGRVPLALMGKVFCRVDGTADPIKVGDLLTTSTVPGHAMRVRDRGRAIGAVIGKALQPCTGRELIPILVTLQ